MSERLVGGFDQYDGMLVPKVQFLTADTAIAVATGKLSIYSITQYPKLMTDIVFDNELHGIFYSSKYIGLIFPNHESGYPYRILVYDLKGNLTGTIPVATDYKNTVSCRTMSLCMMTMMCACWILAERNASPTPSIRRLTALCLCQVMMCMCISIRERSRR